MKKLNTVALTEGRLKALEHEGTRSYCGVKRNNQRVQNPVRERRVLPVEGGIHEGDYILFNYVDAKMGCGKRATAVVTGVTRKFLIVDQTVREGVKISTCILLSDIQVGIVVVKKLTAATYSSDYNYDELDVYHWDEENGQERLPA